MIFILFFIFNVIIIIKNKIDYNGEIGSLVIILGYIMKVKLVFKVNNYWFNFIFLKLKYRDLDKK